MTKFVPVQSVQHYVRTGQKMASGNQAGEK